MTICGVPSGVSRVLGLRKFRPVEDQDRKLKTFKGVKGTCLTQFVEKYPEKKAYFEISNETMKFVFPEPGPLEGVKSRSKVRRWCKNMCQGFCLGNLEHPLAMICQLFTGWWFGCHFLFSHILGIVIPIDFHIFQRGGYTTTKQFRCEHQGVVWLSKQLFQPPILLPSTTEEIFHMEQNLPENCQVILRMNNVSFTYPTKDKPTIMDVSLTVSQVSGC